MGLLALGTPLGWADTKRNAQHVREWGIEQLLAIWSRAKGKECDAMLWGDEVPDVTEQGCISVQEMTTLHFRSNTWSWRIRIATTKHVCL